MIVDKFSTSIIYESFNYFNLIGTVCSLMKIKWKNLLLRAKEPKENHQKWIKGNHLRICKSFPEQVQLKIFKSCKRLIKKYLKQYLPNSSEIQYLKGLRAKCWLCQGRYFMQVPCSKSLFLANLRAEPDPVLIMHCILNL